MSDDNIKEKLENLNINENDSKIIIDKDDNKEDDGIKSILLRNIGILSGVLNDIDSFENLIISYLIKDENKRINNEFNLNDLWDLITKICESWNTKELLGFDVPISKEELESLFNDICKTNYPEKNNEENDLKVLDIYQIKPIILIIFENIILGYQKIIENF